MATRQDIQIAQDLIRFVNIMNDLIDCASYILREKDPQTGNKFQIQEGEVSRDATLEELKENVKRTGQNMIGYWNTITAFKNKYGGAKLKTALESMGVDVLAIQADLANLDTEARHVWQNIQAAQTKAELLPFADRIDANVPKLILVRRSWSLEI